MTVLNLSVDMTGRTAIVTGANSGIGLWTAVNLAKMGASVVLVCRNETKGRKAQSFVAKAAGRPAPNLYLADFASLKAVDDLARRVLQAYPHIHILINNAGLFSPTRTLSQDDYELTFAVNHLAPFLLTDRLLPALQNAASDGGRPSRIVNVSSAAARRARMNFDDLMQAQRYNMLGAYSQSKLANILFTKELARRLDARRITANCLHPGVVATGIGKKGGVIGVAWGLIGTFVMTPEQGATNSTYVATAPELDHTSGVFFVKQKPELPNPIAQDPAAAARLWAESERLISAALAA